MTRPTNATVQTTTFIPPALLPRERAAEIFDMLDAGFTKEEIVQDQLDYMKLEWQDHYTTLPKMGHARQRVETLLLNKWRYCPDIDEIAVERAYDGDRAAWLALTHYERQEVVQRLFDLWQRRMPHRKWPEDECSGISPWAKSVGENPHRITGLRKGPDGTRRRDA